MTAFVYVEWLEFTWLINRFQIRSPEECTVIIEHRLQEPCYGLAACTGSRKTHNMCHPLPIRLGAEFWPRTCACRGLGWVLSPPDSGHRFKFDEFGINFVKYSLLIQWFRRLSFLKRSEIKYRSSIISPVSSNFNNSFFLITHRERKLH